MPFSFSGVMTFDSGPNASKMNNRIHLRLYPQCGICVQVIETGDAVRAVYRGSPTTFNCTHVFRFPEEETTIMQREGLDFCRRTKCCECTISPETVQFHTDCYDLFMKECVVKGENAVRVWLWAVAAWRKPWEDAQPLFLSYPMKIDKSVVDAAATRIGLPELAGIPLELVGIIRSLSECSLFWRCVSAISLAAYISETKYQPSGLQMVPLREILDWERGSTIARAPPGLLPPIIKITIDFDGISSISRLPCLPEYSGARSTQIAYIVASEDDEAFRGVEVHLIYGRLRLVLPADGRLPQIWNTPTPPLLSSLSASMTRCCLFTAWPRLTAVEPDEIRGMTFFLDKGDLCNIHIHYPGGPPPQDTYENMGDEFEPSIAWIYVPISKDDRLTGLGMRQNHSKPFNMLVRTEKSGDIIVGSYQNSFKDECFGSTAPLTFIYQQSKLGASSRDLGFMGIYSAGAPTRNFQEDFPPDRYVPSPLCMSNLFPAVYFSWAPLEAVSYVDIFYDDTRVTKGIVLHYLNGGCRAVGECRVGVHQTQRVVNPSTVCILNTVGRDSYSFDPLVYKTWAEFQQTPEHQHPPGEEWRCQPMAQLLKSWCTSESSFMVVDV